LARDSLITVLRTTRANLNAQASAVNLFPGEIYFVTDESRLAVGVTTSTYQDFAKLSEAGGSITVATGRLLGRSSYNAAGPAEEISPAHGLILEGTGLAVYKPVVNRTANSTETFNNGDVVVKASTAGIVITLPTAAFNTATYHIKNMTTGIITVDADGTETIDGGLTATLSMQYETLTLRSDGTNWLVI
jgi:hypothetical protein